MVTKNAKPAPTVGVVRAFRVHDRRLRPLAGGQGEAWSDGRLVLKPIGFEPEHDWVCDVFAGWPAADQVRVPEPVQSYDDTWSVEGWGAHVRVPGRTIEIPAELDVVRAASDAFHAVISRRPRPDWMDDRQDPWTQGDRVAWDGAMPTGGVRTLALVDVLRSASRPVRSESQVIHGDLLSNVLVEAGAPPAVIDWPPYYRPAAFALAVAATDAVTFAGAPISLFDDWETGLDWDQLLVRALVYRLATAGQGDTDVDRVAPVADRVLARLRRSGRD